MDWLSAEESADLLRPSARWASAQRWCWLITNRRDRHLGAIIDAPGKVTVKASKTEAPKGALGPDTYQAKHIILATGARPRVLSGLEPDKKLIWTYFEAMLPERMPKSLLVVGSGAIGIEFASFYRNFGAEVTVVEILPQILPAEDAEISAFARKQFEKQGIKILTDTKVAKLEKKPDGVTN
jgi:dihydrolipoamide dehydrogenase